MVGDRRLNMPRAAIGFDLVDEKTVPKKCECKQKWNYHNEIQPCYVKDASEDQLRNRTRSCDHGGFGSVWWGCQLFIDNFVCVCGSHNRFECRSEGIRD
jgi:hypothetical protein